MTTRTDPWQTLLFDTLLALWTLEATAEKLAESIATAHDLVGDVSTRMDRATLKTIYEEAAVLFAIEQHQVMR